MGSLAPARTEVGGMKYDVGVRECFKSALVLFLQRANLARECAGGGGTKCDVVFCQCFKSPLVPLFQRGSLAPACAGVGGMKYGVGF